MTEDEKVFNEMEKAEKKALNLKKKNNYRFEEIECCMTCKNIRLRVYPEEGDECRLLSDPFWAYGEIENIYICDKYSKNSELIKRLKEDKI